MLYSLIETAQAAAPGEMCVQAVIGMIVIGVIIFIAVTFLKNLKLLG